MAEEQEKMDVGDGEEDIDTTMNELSQMIEGEEKKEDAKEETDDATKTEKKTESGKKEPEESKKKKKKVIDKTVRPPVISAVQGTVVINNFKMKDAKMKDFLTVLSKAENFVFEYADKAGKITLHYAPQKDFKALGICQILADLIVFAPEVEIETSPAFMNEINADKCGIRRQLISQAKDKTLYVNNITNDTSEELLRALVPDSTKAIIPVDDDGNRKGWAVLEFRNGKEADDCMKNVREVEIGTDHKVTISRAETSDVEEVTKALEEYKKNPPKKKQPPKVQDNKQTKNKRGWNQGPGFQQQPKSLLSSSPRGFGMGGGMGMRSGGMMMGNMSGGMGRMNMGGRMGMGGMGMGGMGGGGMGMGGGYGDGGRFDSGGMRNQSSKFGGNQDAMMEFLQEALDEIKTSKGQRGGNFGGSGGNYGGNYGGSGGNYGGNYGGGSGYDDGNDYDNYNARQSPNKRGRWGEDREYNSNFGSGNKMGYGGNKGGYQQNKGGYQGGSSGYSQKSSNYSGSGSGGYQQKSNQGNSWGSQGRNAWGSQGGNSWGNNYQSGYNNNDQYEEYDSYNTSSYY